MKYQMMKNCVIIENLFVFKLVKDKLTKIIIFYGGIRNEKSNS